MRALSRDSYQETAKNECLSCRYDFACSTENHNHVELSSELPIPLIPLSLPVHCPNPTSFIDYTDETQSLLYLLQENFQASTNPVPHCLSSTTSIMSRRLSEDCESRDG